MLKYAYENVPFYHKKFDDAKVKPGDVNSVDDLAKIPITTKTEIQVAQLASLISPKFPFGKCRRKTTSGSTGTPLTIMIDSRALEFENALWTRANLENGLRFRDKMAMRARKIVEGRKDDFLTATDGRVVSPTIFFPFPFKNYDRIRQFKVIQEKRDKLKIQLSLKEEFPEVNSILEKAESEVKRVFGEDMQVEFQIVEEIKRDPMAKLRKVVSRVLSSPVQNLANLFWAPQ